MSLWKIAWRSLQQRALSSWLTGLSMALGVALVALVLVIYGMIDRSFSEAAQGYNLIVGKQGSPLQLVFNTVFHLSKPIENIPWSYYKKFVSVGPDGKRVDGEFSKYVEVAVPYCLGDSYGDFRVVGTTPDLFEKLSYGSYSDGTRKQYRCAQGRFFRRDEFLGAVIGSVAAHQSDLTLGKKFSVTHGVPDNPANADVHNEVKFTVVGILEPTGTPNDRAVFINLEGFFKIPDHAGAVAHEDNDHDAHEEHGHPRSTGDTTQAAAPPAVRAAGPDAHAADAHHPPKKKEAGKGKAETAAHEHAKDADHEAAEHADPDHDEDHDADHDPDHDAGHGAEEHHHHHHHHAPIDFTVPLPENQREVTAVLVLLKMDAMAPALVKKINKGTTAQAVYPAREVTEFVKGTLGIVRWMLLILAVLVVVVAGIGVMVSIYNSMSDRSREIAIMRSLGASRATVMTVVLLESILLSLLGGLAGVVLAHGTIGALGPVIVNLTGVSIHMFQFEPVELILIPALVALAALVGYLPALTAYRTDVAKALGAAP